MLPGLLLSRGINAFTIDATTGNTFRPFNGSTDQYNFGPANHYQRPDRRYSLGAMGHYELTEHADVYTQLMFTDYSSIAQIAPGGNFFNSNSVNCGNPFLSAQQLGVLGCTAADVAANNSATLYVARRNVEGGGRQQAFENSSFRSLLGVRGAITDTWDYDVSVQYSKVKADQRTLNYFKVDRIQRSLNVVADPTTGAPVCMSALDGTDPACVPYNIFQIGGVTQGALDYLQVPGLQQGTIDQTIYQGIITGDLANIGVKSPWHRRHPAGVRCGVPQGQAQQPDRRLVDVGPAFRLGWRDDQHQRRDGGHGSLHRSPHPDPRRRAVCRHHVGRRRLPLFGLRLAHDRHLQVRHGLGPDPGR